MSQTVSSMPDLHPKFGIPEEFRTRPFAFTMLVVAVIYSPSLFWALGLDQNIFAEIGSLILTGKKPYVDAWDVKPPNIYYTYAFFEWLLGPNDFAIRIADYLASLASCAAIYIAVRRWLANLGASSLALEVAPVVAALLLSLTFLSLGLADTAQTESFAVLFILIAATLASRGESKTRMLFAGAALGIATFFKTTNALFPLPIALELALLRGATRATRVRVVGILLLGWIGWCALQLGVLAIEGSLAEYLRITQSVLLHHPNEVSTLTISRLFHSLWTLTDCWSTLVIVAIVCASLSRKTAFLRSIRLPLLLVFTGLLAVYFQNKGWGYHYVIVLPGLVWACALAAVYFFELLSTWKKGAALSASAIIIILTLFLSPSAHRRSHYINDSFASITSHEKYLTSLGSPRSLYYPPATEQLASYLRANTTHEDRIFIFGEEPGAYWKSDRIPATRFTYALLFTSSVISPEELSAMNDTLIRTKPACIVIERFDTLFFRGRPETSESLVQTDPQYTLLRNLLQSEYHIVDTVAEKFIIYRRKL